MPVPIESQKARSTYSATKELLGTQGNYLSQFRSQMNRILENNNVINDEVKALNENSLMTELEQSKDSDQKCMSNVPFPHQLHDILSNESHSNIITWLPHGKAFVVLDKKKFTETVSPNYFKETKYESFTRKLNRWNFVRISKGPYAGAFEHEYFLRDDVPKCSKIRCQKKYERKKPRAETLKKKVQEAKEKKPVAMNEVPSGAPSLRSFSLDAIKQAQMQQVQRRCLLNYLSLKQQYEQKQNREMFLKSHMCYEKPYVQVLNDVAKKRRISEPDSPLNVSPLSLQQQSSQKKLSPISLPKSSIPSLPTITMPSPPENEWDTKLPFEPKVEDVSSDVPCDEAESQSESISKMPTVSVSDELPANNEGAKLSVLVNTATCMPSVLKENDYHPSKHCEYFAKSNLPPKKKIQQRLYADEPSCSIHARPSDSKAEELSPMFVIRASAA